jgi:hypothetical protein
MIHDILIILLGCIIFVAPFVISDQLGARNKKPLYNAERDRSDDTY